MVLNLQNFCKMKTRKRYPLSYCIVAFILRNRFSLSNQRVCSTKECPPAMIFLNNPPYKKAKDHARQLLLGVSFWLICWHVEAGLKRKAIGVQMFCHACQRNEKARWASAFFCLLVPICALFIEAVSMKNAGLTATGSKGLLLLQTGSWGICNSSVSALLCRTQLVLGIKF